MTQSHCVSAPGSGNECRTAPDGCRPSDEADGLEPLAHLQEARNVHPPSPYIITPLFIINGLFICRKAKQLNATYTVMVNLINLHFELQSASEKHHVEVNHALIIFIYHSI